MKRKVPVIGLPSDGSIAIKPKKTFSIRSRASPGKVFSGHKDRGPISKIRTSEVFFCSVSSKTPKEKDLLGNAYDEPKKYEEQQISNAHLNAESAILNRLRKVIWPFDQEKATKSRSYLAWQDEEHQHSEDKIQSIVSLGCGSGWLDRRVIDMLSYDLKRAHGRLRLLGIDTHPDNIECARIKMKKMLDEDHKLRDLIEVEYLLANLEGPTVIPINDSSIAVPGFSSIDLKKTVIREKSPDLFLAFYLFYWTQDKDAAIRAIAEKSRVGKSIKNSTGHSMNSTRFISGEEFPLHITPNPYMTENFKNGVRNYAKPIDIEELWKKLAENGFEPIVGTKQKQPLKSSDEHWIHYQVMEFKGRSK